MLSLLEKILFFLALFIALGLAFREAWRKIGLIKHGQPVKRSDKSAARFFYTIRKVLFQTPVISQRPVTGLFHGFIFWGFLVFMFVTINHVFEGFFHDFLPFGHGLIYKWILFGANVFGGLILVAIAYFLIRRYVFRPAGLEVPSYQSLIVLMCILVLMLSFFFYEGFKLQNSEYLLMYGAYDFIARMAMDFVLPSADQITPSARETWLGFLWWLHILVVMGFGVFILYSKHLHLIAGPINIFFRQRGVKAEIPVVNLEEQEKFGTPHIRDLNRKDLLDLFSCAECGRCENVCPALSSGKSLSPKELLNKLKLNLMESEKILQGKEGELKLLMGEVVSDEELWDCTSCAACMEVCPMMNEHISKIMGIRQYGVLMESRFPEEFQLLYKGLENQGNPWGIGSETRNEWGAELDIPLMAEKGETDILLWVGCAGSYDQHSQKIMKALVRIMKEASLDFASLGNEEMCCGDPARRTGMEYLFQILAAQNIETLKRYRFKRIVTACPHGLHVLKNEYTKMGGDFEVVHHTQLLAELIREKKITIPDLPGQKTTYHDPCYLGRYNEIYDEPRQVIKGVPGAELLEMANHKKTSFCCGAGGGGMWKEEHTGERISHLRLKQAHKAGAEILVTACPFCSIMFRDAISETGIESVRTLDLAQLISPEQEKN